MAQDRPRPADADDMASGDPWQAFSYLVSGVLLYGLVGWLLDRWLGTSYLVVVGIMVGISLGMFMTWRRFRAPVADSPQIDQTQHGSQHPDEQLPHDQPPH